MTAPIVRTVAGTLALRGREPIVRDGVRHLRRGESVALTRV